MELTVLFFGVLKEITGLSQDSLQLDGAQTIGAIWDSYSERFPRLRDFTPHVRFARNREFSAANSTLSSGDEVAFLPPVSGGSVEDPNLFVLTREPIDSRAVARAVQRSHDGAVVTFEGVVRDNTKGRRTEYLEYECYESMAVQMFTELGRKMRDSHAIDGIAITHRLGRLEVGEVSVAIAVSAPHRKAAFAACKETIDLLKTTVPIWKKEYFADGELWVDGEWDDSALRR